MKKKHQHQTDAFHRLLDIMDELREKCPWDRKQTWQSLRHLTIEELYELSDAVLKNDREGVKEELGDIMLHVVFYAKIASEKNWFDMTGVILGLCDKLIERHPHIYGNEIAEEEEAVKKNWERIKLNKKNTSVLHGLPKSLPSMIKAMRIQDKVSHVGFDWSDREAVWEKVQEELAELHNEVDKVDHEEDIKAEFGDVLFSLINYARFVGINPEEALEHTNRKFIKRFQYMEEESDKKGQKITNMTPKEMDRYWEQAKILVK